jgi:hypothetical protein
MLKVVQCPKKWWWRFPTTVFLGRRSVMSHSQLSNSRFVVGVVLIIIAVLIFLFAEGGYKVSGAIALAVIGLISIANARRG